jgi:hypothetical protein
MKTRSISCAAMLVLTAACSTVNYQSPQFTERARHHQIIAVLPFEMVLTGDTPEDLTAQQIAEIEEAESVAFQEAYYYRLLHQASAHRKHPIRIEIQPVETTNRLLAEAGIGVRESWSMSAKSLAGVLRVDAVISTSVRKTRYLSAGESFGVDFGLNVFNEVTEGKLESILPWGLATSDEIWANCELIDAIDGVVIWQTDFAQATDWRCPPNQVIAGFTDDLAKRFPYRG